MSNDHSCIYEERLSNLESDIAELNARLDGKKEDIYSINRELLRDRDQQSVLIEKVTAVTVLLKESQKQRTENNQKLEELEKKIDNLQTEVTNNKVDVAELTSSLNSFRNTMLALIPIVSIIVGVILHFIGT